MEYKYVWGDGQLGLGPAFNKSVHHFNILQDMIDSGQLPAFPENYSFGQWGEDTFHAGISHIKVINSQGQVPNEEEMKFIIEQKLENKSASVREQLDLMKIHSDASETLDKWVYVRGKGGDVWSDIEFNRGLQNAYYDENWQEGESPPEFWDEVRAHVDAIGDLIGEDINWQTAGAETYEMLEKLPIGRGMVDPDTGKFTGDFENGVTPEEVNVALFEGRGIWDGADDYDLRDAFGKSSEDTEPEYNFSFLTDPHDELYPPVFEGETIKPGVIDKLKAHVLDALKEEFPSADNFIYFTIYGSGISYNWDEEGDFDIQMWVDIDKYDGEQISQDDLVTAIRRIVQPVNFPTFEEVVGEGDMLIQYYPKPGTGSADENLASQPYACLDMETGEWLKEPEPITPEFYGDMFLSVKNKADDVALQAESLLSELERNIVSWHFWSAMDNKYDNKLYAAQRDEAKENAIQNQEGVTALFKGVFGGRAEAYTPDGKGIKDERDIVQKLLEVWGVFQRLKHMARLALPWDTQEIESSTQRTAKWGDITEKAKRLMDSNQVFIEENTPQYVKGTVQGDNGTYSTEIYRQDQQSGAITQWTCTCPWGEHSWGRTRQWRKYEGRPCAHTLALYWTGLSTPVADEAQLELEGMPDTRQQSPDVLPYGAKPPAPMTFEQQVAPQPAPTPGGPNAPTKTAPVPPKPAPQAPPPPSHLKTDKEVKQLEFPGTFSSWRLATAWTLVGGAAIEAAKEVGGFTITSTTFADGQAYFAALQEYQEVVPFDEYAIDRLEEYRDKFSDLLKDISLNVGGWIDEGMLYLDLSRAFQDKDEAEQFGQDNEQIAIWDGFKGAEIRLASGNPVFKQFLRFIADDEERSEERVSSFNSGDKVKANRPMIGYDRDGIQHTVKRNMTGEILWSDDDETIAIFPLNNGPLEAHLVKVTDGTNYFSLQPNAQPFVKKPRP